MSAVPEFSMRELIEAGVHFGHKTRRWNPRMEPFIFGVRNDIHIIDLGKTVPMLHHALTAVRDTMTKNGRLLFVGTKRQSQDAVAEAAKRCGQYYINHRWLGGLLTNWSTIQNSIKTLRKLDEQLAGNIKGFTKKEMLQMTRQRDKLEASLGGIKDMGGRPDMLFIIDTTKEDLAVLEAAKLGIPVMAIIDSNASFDGITYPVPGNDDSTRAIKLYCQLVADAALAGLQQSLAKSGADIGARANTGDTVIDMAAAAEASKAKPEATATEEKKESAKSSHGKRNAPKKAPVVTVKKPAPGKGKVATAEQTDDSSEPQAE